MKASEKANSILFELIRINSSSGREGTIIGWLEEFFRKIGLKVERQSVAEGRDNLLYSGGGDFLISCHVDTVPPSGMKGAFSPRLEDGKIYGRGASDVKGPLASLLTALEDHLVKKGSSDLPLSLAFVVDEESNSALGSERSSEFFSGKVSRCLVLEPTYGKFCTAQLGSLEFSIVVEGPGAHSAEFERVENPVRVVVGAIERLEKVLSRKVNVLMIKGGRGIYVVPDTCHALLEIKVYKKEDWTSLFRKITDELARIKTSLSIKVQLEDAENYIDLGSQDLARWLGRVYKQTTGHKPAFGSMPSWTDATNYYKRGIKTVIYGESNLQVSHTRGEYIEVKDLEKMVNFFSGLIESLV